MDNSSQIVKKDNLNNSNQKYAKKDIKLTDEDLYNLTKFFELLIEADRENSKKIDSVGVKT